MYVAIFKYINVLLLISIQYAQKNNIYSHYFAFTIWF